MSWSIVYLPEARKDLASLDNSQREMVRRMIEKTAANPLPVNQGGYGKPLGKKQGIDLTGLLKIKLRHQGLRVIYKASRHRPCGSGRRWDNGGIVGMAGCPVNTQ